MTPQAPISDRPPVEQAPQPVPRQPATPPPSAWPPTPPPEWYAPQVMSPPQQRYFTPTPAQRLGLAITSLALLIPLLAIAIGSISALEGQIAADIAVATGLILTFIVCFAVVAVNVVFNFDLIRRQS